MGDSPCPDKQDKCVNELFSAKTSEIYSNALNAKSRLTETLIGVVTLEEFVQQFVCNVKRFG